MNLVESYAHLADAVLFLPFRLPQICEINRTRTRTMALGIGVLSSDIRVLKKNVESRSSLAEEKAHLFIVRIFLRRGQVMFTIIVCLNGVLFERVFSVFRAILISKVEPELLQFPIGTSRRSKYCQFQRQSGW